MLTRPPASTQQAKRRARDDAAMLSPSPSVAELGTPFAGLHSSHYGAIVADPAWGFKPWAAPDPDASGRRDTERHYATMSLAEIKALPVADLAARDCWLFLWTIASHLPQALEVIEAWGFKYSSVAFTWVKLKRSRGEQLHFLPLQESDLHVGMGHTTRKGTEPCLLARRGHPKRLAKDVREVILAPVRQHSRKPDEAYARVQRYCAGPYAELFARESRTGWDAWGDEIGKFDRQPEHAHAPAIAPI
jgi:N6-adenosine-specific RNA methylase IME4